MTKIKRILSYLLIASTVFVACRKKPEAAQTKSTEAEHAACTVANFWWLAIRADVMAFPVLAAVAIPLGIANSFIQQSKGCMQDDPHYLKPSDVAGIVYYQVMRANNAVYVAEALAAAHDIDNFIPGFNQRPYLTTTRDKFFLLIKKYDDMGLQNAAAWAEMVSDLYMLYKKIIDFDRVQGDYESMSADLNSFNAALDGTLDSGVKSVATKQAELEKEAVDAVDGYFEDTTYVNHLGRFCRNPKELSAAEASYKKTLPDAAIPVNLSQRADLIKAGPVCVVMSVTPRCVNDCAAPARALLADTLAKLKEPLVKDLKDKTMYQDAFFGSLAGTIAIAAANNPKGTPDELRKRYASASASPSSPTPAAAAPSSPSSSSVLTYPQDQQ